MVVSVLFGRGAHSTPPLRQSKGKFSKCQGETHTTLQGRSCVAFERQQAWVSWCAAAKNLARHTARQGPEGGDIPRRLLI